MSKADTWVKTATERPQFIQEMRSPLTPQAGARKVIAQVADCGGMIIRQGTVMSSEQAIHFATWIAQTFSDIPVEDNFPEMVPEEYQN